jgi:hypothetical protein
VPAAKYLVEGLVHSHHRNVLPEFLNVDLEIESTESLALIAQELGDNVYVLNQGPYRGSPHMLAVEIHAVCNHDPDSIMEAFLDLIENLSSKARAVWRKSTRRRFDLGIASGTTSKKNFKVFTLELQPKTMKRAAALAAQIVVTVYPKTVAAKRKKE